MANGLNLIAKELEANWPGTGQWVNIENAAAQSEFTLLGDLRFGFVPLIFQPFNEVEGVQLFSAEDRAGVFLQPMWRKGALQERNDTCCDQWRIALRGRELAKFNQ